MESTAANDNTEYANENKQEQKSKEVETAEFHWHGEHHISMHEGFGCIGGKNGGTPSALKCQTNLYAAHTGMIGQQQFNIPDLAIVTARCQTEMERNFDQMNIRFWTVQ